MVKQRIKVNDTLVDDLDIDERDISSAILILTALRREHLNNYDSVWLKLREKTNVFYDDIDTEHILSLMGTRDETDSEMSKRLTLELVKAQEARKEAERQEYELYVELRDKYDPDYYCRLEDQ